MVSHNHNLDKNITVNTSQEVFFKVQIIEGFNGLEPVGIDIGGNLLFLFHAGLR